MARPTKHDIAVAILELTRTISEKKLAHAVAAYVVSERRTSELDAIMREVKRLREKQTGVVEVDVTTAVPATAAVKKSITKLLGNKAVVINEIVDKDVIGGVRVETNDLSLDLTVRNRLNRLKVIKTGATS